MKSLIRSAVVFLAVFAIFGCKEEAKSTPVNSPSFAPVNPQDKEDDAAKKKAADLNKNAK